ncbi:hypothetical protein GQX73_g10212 [Xylaria multiplex]|uniref:Uncharacterized protein n=1 Tax=Xylaria multiplex TaxID=323545 RepID=A0A7C8IJT3_9PEZI|nr:hypothetical protein GQX73_g10212 [Xylaria multiplex]
MAQPQNRKRQRVDELSQDDSPAKKTKTRAEPQNFPPQFWDRLSKVWLTPRALRELDRRNSIQPRRKSKTPDVYTTTLARFAQRGGPDLCHIRGYPEFQIASHTIASSRSGASSRQSQSTLATGNPTRSRRSSAYDKNFEQHLIDHKIYPPGYIYPDQETREPGNDNDNRLAISAPRRSLSPSRFPPSAFKKFVAANDRVLSEGKVMSDVLPMMYGDADILNEGNLCFTNLDSITENTTVDPVPDLFDGIHPVSIEKEVRTSPNKIIIPTNHCQALVAPNFFLKAEAPMGEVDVLRRQACLDGAYGARAMHALQNYGKETPEYDGNAYTFSSTYHAGLGMLSLYSHHVTAPTSEGGLPEYHMTKLRGFDLTDTLDTFIAGASAFRNSREVAQRHRDRFILEANTRAAAAGLDVVPNGDNEIVHGVVEQGDASSPDEFVDCEETTDPPVNTPPHPPQYPTEDEAFELSQTPLAGYEGQPSMSFSTSFTPSLGTDPSRSKRSRQSSSPPSTPNQGQSGKRRVRPNIFKGADNESLPGTSSQQIEAGESLGRNLST